MAEKRFDQHGREYRPVELGPEECLAWTQVVDAEGESFDRELVLVRADTLHETPPTEKVDEKITKLQATLLGLRNEIAERRKELEGVLQEAAERMAKLKQHKGLERLEDFVAGRITHYVKYSYGPPEIIRFEDATTDDASGRVNKLKLLTLFGRTNGNLEWGLNRWSDGSGCSSTVIPCTSYLESVGVAKEQAEAHEEKALSASKATRPESRWKEMAEGYGFEMSLEYLRVLAERKAKAKTERISKIEAELGELRDNASSGLPEANSPG